MPFYKVTITIESKSEPAVRKMVAALFSTVQGTTAVVEKLGGRKTRAERLAVAEADVDNAKGVVEELLEEMTSWKDSIPENLQDGEKANEVQEAIDNLETIRNSLDEADFSNVSFPGMR